MQDTSMHYSSLESPVCVLFNDTNIDMSNLLLQPGFGGAGHIYIYIKYIYISQWSVFANYFVHPVAPL